MDAPPASVWTHSLRGTRYVVRAVHYRCSEHVRVQREHCSRRAPPYWLLGASRLFSFLTQIPGGGLGCQELIELTGHGVLFYPL
eukprot:scaffold278899_cov33-Tisochrysis_lutea.AAC.1